jgi:hypothetical protein
VLPIADYLHRKSPVVDAKGVNSVEVIVLGVVGMRPSVICMKQVFGNCSGRVFSQVVLIFCSTSKIEADAQLIGVAESLLEGYGKGVT